jgi:hypothetical protein
MVLAWAHVFSATLSSAHPWGIFNLKSNTPGLFCFAGTCVGVEVAGTSTAVQQLEAAAAATSKALVTSSAEVAKQYRFWGMDG